MNQMQKAPVVIDNERTLAPAVTPIEMLNNAVARGADIVMIEKLMALHERFEAGQSRRAFDAAIADAKAEISPVVRNKAGHNNKRYADFSAIALAVDPILSKHGLSYRFRTAQSDKISVTCILSHKAGHSEETTLAGPADTSGSKNAIQAIGSTLTYLQRYSLVQALGLAAADDDDGKAAGRGVEDDAPITAEQADAIRDLIAAAGLVEKAFCEYAKIERIEDMAASKYQTACTRLEQRIKLASEKAPA